jgi:septal ring factor EnvC (AmiA/AmiB activator)
MNDAVVIAAVAALPGLAGALLAYLAAVRAAKTTSQNETLKVEAGAYERARQAYEAGIRQMEEQVERLRKQVIEERDVSDKLRKRVAEMEETLAWMRTQLIKAGIPLAPPASSQDRSTQ